MIRASESIAMRNSSRIKSKLLENVVKVSFTAVRHGGVSPPEQIGTSAEKSLPPMSSDTTVTSPNPICVRAAARWPWAMRELLVSPLCPRFMSTVSSPCSARRNW